MNTFYIVLIMVLVAIWLVGLLMLEIGEGIHLLFFIALGLMVMALIKSEKK